MYMIKLGIAFEVAIIGTIILYSGLMRLAESGLGV